MVIFDIYQNKTSLDSSKIHQTKCCRVPKSAKIACLTGKTGHPAQHYGEIEYNILLNH